MIYTNTRETALESLIVEWLVEHNGYEQGHSHDFNVEYAVDAVSTCRKFRQVRTEGKLERDSVVATLATTAADGKNIR
ncbi:MAG: hypothetical protein ACI4VB_00525 [Bradymonadia bacterium]